MGDKTVETLARAAHRWQRTHDYLYSNIGYDHLPAYERNRRRREAEAYIKALEKAGFRIEPREEKADG